MGHASQTQQRQTSQQGQVAPTSSGGQGAKPSARDTHTAKHNLFKGSSRKGLSASSGPPSCSVSSSQRVTTIVPSGLGGQGSQPLYHLHPQGEYELEFERPPSIFSFAPVSYRTQAGCSSSLEFIRISFSEASTEDHRPCPSSLSDDEMWCILRLVWWMGNSSFCCPCSSDSGVSFLPLLG